MSLSSSSINILLLNPNSSLAMTKTMESAANTIAASYPSMSIGTYTAPEQAPASIDNEDGINASVEAVTNDPGFMTCIRSTPFDAVLVACFSVHPLVKQLAYSLKPVPVIGIFEASILTGLFLIPTAEADGVHEQHKWGIVTTGAFWETHLFNGVAMEDVSLAGDIGWDLVEMLIPIPGSEECLESIARLGNPREVILKVLEVMEKTTAAGEEAGEEEVEEEKKAAADGSTNQVTKGETKAIRHFVTLCGMLGILLKRLQVKAPSRFLHTTLETVQRCYDATSAASTAAVISLVQSLAHKARPPLPSRKSSIKLDTPFQDSDPTKQAPDPEANRTDTLNANEPGLINSLLQSFITCIFEAYVNSNNVEWASRMLEYTYPERIVPGRKTMIQTFKEVVELQAKDALLGQLVSLAGDLGLAKLAPFKMKEYLEGPIYRTPLSIEFDPAHPEQLHLSTGGLVCLNAYWMFAADVFDADRGLPTGELYPQYMLPDHQALLQSFLGDESGNQIATNPGTFEALIVMAIWLDGRKALAKPDSTGAVTGFMPYHHLLTLVSIFHPNIRVRNATTVVAGSVLHADPDEEDRLAILEDLLENCVFSSLQACAVAWLREELIAAKKAGSKGRFSGPECFETIQYTLFPDLSHLQQADASALLEFWAQNAPLHLQVANFALFLFGEDYKSLAPVGMAAAIEHRYVEPLLHAARTLEKAAGAKEIEAEGEILMQLGILTDTLSRVSLQ